MENNPARPRPGATPDDRIAIADLFSRYALHFDRNEPDLVASLFTADAVVDYGPEFPPIRGRDSIADRIRPGLEGIFIATSHHVSNVLVEMASSDRAEATAYVYAWHRYVDRSADGHLWGQYRATVRRVAGEWRFSTFRLETFAVEDFHRERMHRVPRRPPDGPVSDQD